MSAGYLFKLNIGPLEGLSFRRATGLSSWVPNRPSVSPPKELANRPSNGLITLSEGSFEDPKAFGYWYEQIQQGALAASSAKISLSNPGNGLSAEWSISNPHPVQVIAKQPVKPGMSLKTLVLAHYGLSTRLIEASKKKSLFPIYRLTSL